MRLLLDEGLDRTPIELDAVVMPRMGEYIRIEETSGLVDFVVEGVMHNFHLRARSDADHVATLKVRRLSRH